MMHKLSTLVVKLDSFLWKLAAKMKSVGDRLATFRKTLQLARRQATLVNFAGTSVIVILVAERAQAPRDRGSVI